MKTLQLYLENTVYKKIVTSLSHKQEMYDSIKAAYEIAKKKWLDSINNKIHPMEIEYYKAKKDILKK
jgi:hypothetical protein